MSVAAICSTYPIGKWPMKTSNRIDKLRVGAAVAAGEFELDQEQARKKLREFQLADPRDYVLEFVKTAHLLGATRIDFTMDADELEVCFDGDTLSASEFDTLYSAPFSQRSTPRQRALRHLAIGVNAAQGMGLRELLIEIGGDAPFAVRLLDDAAEELKAPGSIAPQTRLYMRERLRPGHFSRFFSGLRNELTEAKILRARCHFAEVAITINGERISHGYTLPADVHSAVDFKRENCQGRLGINFELETATTYILQHGVLITTDVRLIERVGARSIVDAAGLTLNLSQSAFVEDDAWSALHASLSDVSLDSLASHLRALDGEPLESFDAMVLLNRLRPMINEFNDSSARHPGIVAVLDALAELPLFEAATGAGLQRERLSIAQARVVDPVSGRRSLFFGARAAAPVLNSRTPGSGSSFRRRSLRARRTICNTLPMSCSMSVRRSSASRPLHPIGPAGRRGRGRRTSIAQKRCTTRASSTQARRSRPRSWALASTRGCSGSRMVTCSLTGALPARRL